MNLGDPSETREGRHLVSDQPHHYAMLGQEPVATICRES